MVFLITSDLKMKLSGIFPRYETYKKEWGRLWNAEPVLARQRLNGRRGGFYRSVLNKPSKIP